MNNYGSEWYFGSDDWRQKRKDIVERDPDFYTRQAEKRNRTIASIPGYYQTRTQKTQQTCLDRFGCKSVLQIASIRERRIQHDMETKMHELECCAYDIPEFGIEELRLNYKDKHYKYTFECKRCGNTFMTVIKHPHAQHYHCTKCFPRCRSICEHQLLDYITSIWTNPHEVMHNNRTLISPYEIDISIASETAKVGFEYTGLYWHSVDIAHDVHNQMKQARRHLQKLEMCQRSGINLVTVFEDEWLNDQEGIKDRISKILGIGHHVSISDCYVEIMGTCAMLKLSSTGQLVAYAKFQRSRFNVAEEWEMLDYCTTPGVIVDSGMNAIVDAFEKKFFPKSLTAFIDRRWSNGACHKACGFEICKVLKPQCWWFNKTDLHRYHEEYFRKNIASELLSCKFINGTHQVEALNACGWMRIYDCGSIKMTKVY